MRKSLVLAALVAGLSGIGGTGHAAPRAVLDAADPAARRIFLAVVADASRDTTLGLLSKDWSGARLAAFARLVAAEQVFARTLAVAETGAAPGSTEATDAEQAARDVFVATVRQLVGGSLSRGASFAASDAALNDAYRRVMAVDDPRELGWGDVDKAGILRTERAWLAYRDAFAAFAATLDGPGAADAVRWELTRQRTASLDAFLGD